MSAEPQTVFISYASPDRDRVTPYFDRLAGRGFDVWMDCRCLKAGQNWDFEIRRTLDRAAIIVVFVSNNSVDRRGYVQREIKLALDKADEKLTSDIYIIPVLLDESAPLPDQLKSIHCVRGWEPESDVAIADAINHQLQLIGVEVRTAQSHANLTWARRTFKENWEGLPGYDVEYVLLELSSPKYQNIGDISRFINGELASSVMEERRVKFRQDPHLMTFGQDRYLRTNTFYAYCSDPILCQNLISITYTVHWYGAGAAHPNMYFKTYAFFLDPVVPVLSLKEMFDDESRALTVIQSEIRSKLLASPAIEEKQLQSRDKEWVERGTEDWGSFRSFVFREKEVEFLFPPYQVDCYAAGPQSACVSYEILAAFMRREHAEALGVGYLRWRALNEKRG